MIAETLALSIAAGSIGELCVVNAAQPFWIHVSGVAIGGDVSTTFEFKHVEVGTRYCVRFHGPSFYELRLIPGDAIDQGTLYLPPASAGEYCAEADTRKNTYVRVRSAKSDAKSTKGNQENFECDVSTTNVRG